MPEHLITLDGDRRRIPAIAQDRIQQILVIGLGGIGTCLLPHLCRYLSFGDPQPPPLRFFDGDDFERRNRERQAFQQPGNKAQVKARELRADFPQLSIRGIPEFVTKANAAFYVPERSLVFLAVDNHQSRRTLSRHCRQLQSAILISGGNEWTDGNVQVYLRWNGTDWTSPLTRFHPEIDQATDSTGLFSCEAAAADGEPQLLFTNLTVAAHMLATFFNVVSGTLCYEEIYFDLLQGRSESIDRDPGLKP